MTKQQVASRIESAAIKALAQKIAADLFGNERGYQTDRLVQVDKQNRHLAGWSQSAMADRIEQHLRGEL